MLQDFPQTLLERSASKVWNEGGDEVFIEGNGHRFQYTLDFMRHGKVTLPHSESSDAFLTEMEYYGIACNEEQVFENEKVSVSNITEILQSMKTATFSNLIAIDIIEKGLMNRTWVNESVRTFEVIYRDVDKFRGSQSRAMRIKNDDENLHINIIKEALEIHREPFIIEQINPIIAKVGLKISGLSKCRAIKGTFSFKVVPLA